MARIAAVYAPKGGVGKTFLTAHLGAGLALTGRRVLLIDADPTQCQLALSFGDLERRGDTYELVTRTPGTAGDLAQQPADLDGLHVITGTPATSRLLPNWLRTSSPYWVETLRQALAPMAADYDYILIDCGPGFDELTACVLDAATEIWFPYRVDYKSEDAYLLLRDHVLPQCRRDESFVRHVVPNFLTLGRRRGQLDADHPLGLMDQARSNDAAAILKHLHDRHGDNLTPPVRAAEARTLESDGEGKTIWHLAPDSPVADDLARVVEFIVAAEAAQASA